MKSLLYLCQLYFCLFISSPYYLVAQTKPVDTSTKKINTQPITVISKDSSIEKLSDSKKQKTFDSSLKTIVKGSIDSTSLEIRKDSLLQESMRSYLTSINPKIFTYDSITYFIESINSFMKDTLEYGLQAYQLKSDSTKKLIISALERYAQKPPDSISHRKNTNDIFEYLYTQFGNYRSHQDSLKKVNKSMNVIKKELTELEQKKQRWNSNNKGIADSIKKYVATVKPKLFSFTYRGVPFRVMIIPMSDYVVKLDPDLLKSTRTLKSSWDGFKKNKPIALFNAGMFNVDGSAVGLQVVDGKILNSINLNKGSGYSGNFYMQPNGVFFVEKSGFIGVKNTADFNQQYAPSKYAEILYATQSGPMLVNNNQINRNFSLKSSNRYIRNGIGVVGEKGNQWLISIISSDDCTFHDIASLFRLFGCSNALYLDGAISVMYAEINGVKTGNLNSGSIGPVLAIFKK